MDNFTIYDSFEIIPRFFITILLSFMFGAIVGCKTVYWVFSITLLLWTFLPIIKLFEMIIRETRKNGNKKNPKKG